MNNAMQYLGTGRRKTSVARVILRSEKASSFVVNKKGLEEYFLNRSSLLKEIKRPLELTNYLDKISIHINVHGGGLAGQAGAVKHGIARALVELDESNRKVLKEEGLLTRDSRRTERKKYGKKKARKSPQFSKR